MKSLLPIVFLLTLYSCLTVPKNIESTKHAKDNDQFYTAVKRHFDYIDSVRKTDPDFIEAENIKLQQTINLFKADIFNFNDTSNYDLLYIVKSPDKKLCLVSWDTRMGGTMIDFATMAIYKTTNGDIFSKMLIDTTESPLENTLMHYNYLYSIKQLDKTVYVAHGFGQGSTALPWQELRAFQIQDKHLSNPKIFPGQKSNLFIEFDTHKMNGSEVPMILVTDSGKTINSPVPTEDEGFDGEYQKLIFREGIYKEL